VKPQIIHLIFESSSVDSCAKAPLLQPTLDQAAVMRELALIVYSATWWRISRLWLLTTTAAVLSRLCAGACVSVLHAWPARVAEARAHCQCIDPPRATPTRTPQVSIVLMDGSTFLPADLLSADCMRHSPCVVALLQLWGTVRFGLLAFLCLSAAGALMDGGGLGSKLMPCAWRHSLSHNHVTL
jgi:hypothetical protein